LAHTGATDDNRERREEEVHSYAELERKGDARANQRHLINKRAWLENVQGQTHAL
jgi:hypothetical protein